MARDAQAECSPEDWFCEDKAPAAPPDLAPAPEPPPSAPEESKELPRDQNAPPPPGMLPEKMNLTPPVSEQAAVEPEEGLLAPWSVNLRLQGVALGSGGDRDAGLGGLGVSLRYAFMPSLAIDLGLDAFGGTDYNGYDRSETSLSTSVLVYLNARRAVRTYVLGGFNASAARVDVAGDKQDWTYVGAQGGLGLDFVISQRISLNVDMLGFIRGRVDSRASREPEFTDGYGNLTNTSGGALFRGGVSIYF